MNVLSAGSMGNYASWIIHQPPAQTCLSCRRRRTVIRRRTCCRSRIHRLPANVWPGVCFLKVEDAHLSCLAPWETIKLRKEYTVLLTFPWHLLKWPWWFGQFLGGDSEKKQTIFGGCWHNHILMHPWGNENWTETSGNRNKGTISVLMSLKPQFRLCF